MKEIFQKIVITHRHVTVCCKASRHEWHAVSDVALIARLLTRNWHGLTQHWFTAIHTSLWPVSRPSHSRDWLSNSVSLSVERTNYTNIAHTHTPTNVIGCDVVAS